MFLVKNEVGEYEDYHTWCEVVRGGQLAAFLEAKRVGPQRREGHRRLFVVTDFGYRLKQKATDLPENPESLFAQVGDSVTVAVLERAHDYGSDNLRMTITRVEDNAFSKAISQAQSALSETGWCSAEMKLVDDQ